MIAALIVYFLPSGRERQEIPTLRKSLILRGQSDPTSRVGRTRIAAPFFRITLYCASKSTSALVSVAICRRAK